MKDIAPAAQPPREPVPIWFAALLASHCQATAGESGHVVRWNCVSGRAIYTNDGLHTERIEPLGVNLQVGQTLAVSWTPGETSYTFHVYRQYDYCA